jgi:putative nucleotidyltransferase with HDIG domain
MPLQNALSKIEYLPTIPETAREVLKLTDNELTAVVTLGKIIDRDVSISSKILNVANSAYFGFGGTVKTVSEAILRIGFLNVKNIAFGLSLMSVFNDQKGKKVMDYERVFEHSATVGVVAKFLSKTIHAKVNEDIFVNGLLHDIGYLVLCHYFMDQYDSVMYDFHRYDEKPLIDAEQGILNFTHAEMGSWLVEKWNLDNTVVDTIRNHHFPSRATSSLDYVAIVHVADYITSENILSVTKKNPLYLLDRASFEILKLSEKDFHDLKVEIESHIFSQ